jgi:hypothetical protein
MVLEKDIEGNVCRWAKKNGFLVVKVRFYDVGYPDRLFISPTGHTIFIEFKRPGEVPDAIQAFRLRMLKGRGIPAYWADNFHTAVSILREALVSEGVPEKSDALASIASLGGTILGSRTRKDVYSVGCSQDPEEQGSNEASIDHSTDSSDVSHLAGGDKEVD